MAFKSKIIVSCIVAIILTISQLTHIKATHLPGPFDNLIQTVSDTIPFNDRQGDFINDKTYNPFDILPTEIEQSVEYDLESDSYIIYEKIGDEYFRTPTSMTFNEYLEWKSKEQDQRYFNKLAGIDDGYRDASGRIDPMKKVDIEKNLVDRLFGGNGITITPQGSIDLNFGGRYTTTDNSTIQESQRNQLFFPDFGMDIKMNVDGKIGDKMDLGFNYDTNASFDFDRKIKLAYDSEKWTEDDIIKKIEAGNVSMPLRSTLIQGAQELFGIKTELQFGNLRLTGLLSQQRSEQQNIQIQNGATVQEFEIRPHEYDENRHFFISHYHRDVYEKALENMPYIDNSFRVTDIEVWISDDRPNFQTDQTIIAAIADIAETDPNKFSNPSSDFQIETNGMIETLTTDINGRRLPDNRVNTLYETIVDDNPDAARLDKTTIVLQSLGLRPATDFETFRGRKLNPSEYYLNPELGFISLNIKLRPNQVLAVSYEYFYTNNCEDVYKVGTLADEGIISNSEIVGNMEVEQPEGVLFTKLLKGSSQNPFSPTWDLMMKNVYPLRANNLDQTDFEFDIYFENDNVGSLDKTLPIDGMRNLPLLNLFGLDRLNSRNDPQSDGVFDFVPGVTVIPQSSSIVFPVLEPFGQTLADAIDSLAVPGPNLDLQNLKDIYVFNELYDSTVTLAELALEENKFVMAGKIKSSTSSEYSLGAWNIPQGSVRVSAGSFQLIEGVHYEVDYGIGRLRILDQSIIQQGVPINISFEDNSVFSLQQKNMLGLRAEYEFSENFYLGGTALKLQERPFTEKVNLGDDPINNRIYGLDMAYNTEAPLITKIVDKLPFYSTNQPSNFNFTAEVAALKPGHNSAINSNNQEDAGGVVSLDDFEGAVSGFPLSSQPNRWVLASPPQIDSSIFREAYLTNDIRAGVNRAKLSWYVIDRFVNLAESDKDANSFTRRINQTELFNRQIPQGQLPDLLTFDMTYYPNERGPYNYDLPNGYPNISAGLAGLGPNEDKLLLNAPETRWAGIMRYLSNNDFQAANYQFIEFWLLNPYNEKPDGSPHIDDEEGFLTFHLGNVSEDILPDNNQFYENATPASETAWGKVPLQAPINDAFVGTDFSPQDLGLDGLTDAGERDQFQEWINEVEAQIVLPPEVRNDPAGDNYVYFNDQVYDASDNLLERYRDNNSPENNSPNVSEVNTFQRGNPIPDKEDLNNNKALDASEKFHQYRIKLKQDGNLGILDESDSDYIRYVTDKRVINAGAAGENETWYRFRIPLNESEKINGIEGFRSIQFLRMLVNGFQTQKTFRMAEFELVRNQWRKEPSICRDGVDGEFPNNDQVFNIDVVGVEENSAKEPFGYQLPPGIIQERLIGTFSQINQDENSLVMRFEDLPNNCEASIVKLTEIDLRTFKRMQMFVHCEDPAQRTGEERQIETGDVSAFIRIGKDFSSHYYEYEIPLQVSDNEDPMATNQREVVWPATNKFNFALDIFTQAKKIRNVLEESKDQIFEIDSETFNSFSGLEQYKSINPYAGPDATIDVEQEDVIFLPAGHKVRIIGNPNLGKIKGINVGVRNISDDGLKDGEVWINELRLAGLLERGGLAGLARMDIQMADLGNLTASSSYSSIGWGAIDQKVNERAKEEVIEFDVATNLALGKFFPQNWGIQLPFYAQYAQSIVNPEFDAYDFDITVKDEFDLEQNGPLNPELPSISERNQTVNTIKTFNLTNVRKERSKAKPPRSSSVGGRNKTKNTKDEKFTEKAAKKPKKPMPWDVENLSTSYSYTEIEYRDPIFTQDNSVTQSLGLDYAYSRRGSYIEPFKKIKSKHLKIIKEFNFNPVPTSFAFNSTIDRYFSTRTYRLPVTPIFEFNDRRFEWERRYDLNWNFTKALKLTFSAFNESYIDEARQEGIAATPAERPWFAFQDNGSGNLVKTEVTTEANTNETFAKDYWKDNLRSGGRNTHYDHSIALNYTLPLKYLPYMDWVDIKGQYRSTYSWDAAPLISFPTGEPLAGVIQNSQNRSLTANLKFDKLYNKSKYLKNLDRPKRQSKRKKRTDKNKDSVTISTDKDGKKVARKKSREISTLEKILVRPILMLRSARLTYKEDFSTVVPGYTGAPQYFGLDAWDSPGTGFVLGLQPDIATFTDNNSNGVFDLGVDSAGNPDNYLDQAAAKGWITNSQGLNQEVIQLKSQNMEAKFKLEPWKDFKVDLDFKKSYRTTHSEVFKFIAKDSTDAGSFQHLAGRDLGSFDMTFYNLNTLFGVHVDSLFQTFEDNRSIISRRLDNFDEAGLHETDGAEYAEGYGKVSSAVLVPSFLAAYTDRNPNDIELSIEDQVRSRAFIPKPNWKLTYNGLSKLPWFKDVFSSFTLEHGYSNQLRVSRFNTNVEYDAFNPFEERKSNGNYYTRIEIPAIQISENFNPVIGVKMKTRSDFTMEFQYNKSRDLNLKINTSSQLEEDRKESLVFGVGYTIKDSKFLKKKKNKRGSRSRSERDKDEADEKEKKKNSKKSVTSDRGSDMTFMLNVGYTDNAFYVHELDVTPLYPIEQYPDGPPDDKRIRGSQVFQINPTVDYVLNDNVTLRAFFDFNQNRSFGTSPFTRKNFEGGVTVRMTLK